jgi:hypothetical protein
MTTRNPIPSRVGITEKRARPGNRYLAELLELLLTKACLAIFGSFSQQIHLVTKELEMVVRNLPLNIREMGDLAG